MNYGGVNELPNAKNRNVLALKLRPVKTFKGEKNETLQESGNSTTDGKSYI